MPQVIRELLIDEYCKESLKLEAKMLAANKDCLIRLYLGKRRASDRPNAIGFSIRNFALHLDQMESLQLDIDYYAQTMADILAVLHFRAKIDADDIEIVLGSAAVMSIGSPRRIQPLSSTEIARLPPGKSTREETNNLYRNFKKRTIHLWILDFNSCKPITMNEQRIDAAVKSYWNNSGQYFPRPLREVLRDNQLWQLFSAQYLESSRRLIEIEKLDPEARNSRHELPKMFLSKVVEVRKRELGLLKSSGNVGRGQRDQSDDSVRGRCDGGRGQLARARARNRGSGRGSIRPETSETGEIQSGRGRGNFHGRRG